ncbi:MAG: hypothetical protein IPM92_08860 [Saprospiraceae bacterium]|nr:hypothetical protein [Saprospiraceae bacterium]
MLAVYPVRTPSDRKEFIQFVYHLYKDDPNFVPELFIAQRDHMDEKKNPYFEHASAELFLAKRGDEIVGRIAAVKDDFLIEYTAEKVGVFGFFDCINDVEVANALLNAASAWLRSHQLEFMEGPYNFSTNHTCGLLVEGFHVPPSIMMTYNKPYYLNLLENYGLSKKTDVIAYRINAVDFPERLKRSILLLEEKFRRSGIIIRKLNLKQFDEDVRKTLGVYNKAWSKNLGFAPMTDKEFLHAGKDMKMIMDPNLVLLAEKEGDCIGFSLTLPDINQILIKIKNGNLLPFGIFKLLFGRKKINSVRIMALGVLEDYRRLGIDAYFYAKAFEYVSQHKYLKSGEASWILEDNPEMNNAILKMGGKVEKKYRFFRSMLK